jgi:thiol-disulfide isomerase/thioredoxin
MMHAVSIPMSQGKLRWNLAPIALALFSGAALAQQTAVDLDGHAVNPLAGDSGKAVVLVFVRRDCPVSSRYAPVIQQIASQYADAANFWLVYPDKNDSAPAIRQHLAEYGYHMPALRDPAHVLVKLSRVQIAPEVAVFDRNRQLIYDGRIDDLHIGAGRARPAATTHELEDAIRAAVAGKSVARTEVRGVGCYISDLE